jgi:hypothetical protein
MKFQIQDSRVIYILDYRYYGSKVDEIDEWCWQQFSYHPREGMVMTFRNENNMSLFLLKWA